MNHDLSKREQERRRILSDQARTIIMQALPVEDADESSLMLSHGGFYLQVAFSSLHPLMVLYLARGMKHHGIQKDKLTINELNLRSVLGSHAINDDVGCYSYRAAHWLDTELTGPRFLEILDRCSEEAVRGYQRLTGSSGSGAL